MKPSASTENRSNARRAGHSAFTVPEYLVTMAVTVIVVGMVLQGYILGARMHVLASTKLNASDQARHVLAEVTHNIRTATSFKIGTGSLSAFSATGVNEQRKGNAIEIYPTSDTNFFIRYFLDTTDNSLKRFTNGSTTVSVLASCLTNRVVFTAEDPWGNVTTNERPAEIVGVMLQFDQPLHLGNAAATNKLATDFYQVRAKVNKRTSMGYQN